MTIELLRALNVLGLLSFFILLVWLFYLVVKFIGWLASGIGGEKPRRMTSEEVQMEVWKGERTAREISGRGNSAWDTAAFNLAKKDLKKHD